MDLEDINKRLQLASLKNKLLITLQYYLTNIKKFGLQCFYDTLDLLKLKYSEDYDIIEGIKNIVINNNSLINQEYLVFSIIYTCNNVELLKEMLESIYVKI